MVAGVVVAGGAGLVLPLLEPPPQPASNCTAKPAIASNREIAMAEMRTVPPGTLL